MFFCVCVNTSSVSKYTASVFCYGDCVPCIMLCFEIVLSIKKFRNVGVPFIAFRVVPTITDPTRCPGSRPVPIMIFTTTTTIPMEPQFTGFQDFENAIKLWSETTTIPCIRSIPETISTTSVNTGVHSFRYFDPL